MRQNSMLAKKNNKSLWTTVAALSAAMVMFLPHAAKAEGATVAADKVTAELNLRQITGNKPVTALSPAPTIVVNAPVAATPEPTAPPIAGPIPLSAAAVVEIANAIDPSTSSSALNLSPANLNNLALTISALNTAVSATDGTLTGQLADQDKAAIISHNLKVARVESQFRPDAVAPASAFKVAENRLDRPADTFQHDAKTFGATLASHMFDIKLTDAQRQAVMPVLYTIWQIADNYASRTHDDTRHVLDRNDLFLKAYRAATPAQKEIVRHARVDMTPVEGQGGKITSGLLLASIAQVYMQDEMPAPPPSMAKYSRSTWYYAVHWLGEPTAMKLGQNRLSLRVRQANPALTRGKKTVAAILSGIERQRFSNMGKLRTALNNNLDSISNPLGNLTRVGDAWFNASRPSQMTTPTALGAPSF